MAIHTPKAFLRGRNGVVKVPGVWLMKFNRKLKLQAIAEREKWDKAIRANNMVDAKGNLIANPITKFQVLHPTKGFRTERF